MRYEIMAQQACGKIFKCFTWSKDKKDGIELARKEAMERRLPVILVWAEPV